MLSLLEDNIKKTLLPLTGGVTLYITVGNNFRGDDGVGPYIAELLCGINNSKISVINAGEHPENIIDNAVNLNPSKIVLIDTASFNGYPGEIRILDEDSISSYILSTHTFPITAVTSIIKEDTGCEVHYIGIQPKNLSLGEGLSLEVKKSAEIISNFVISNSHL